MVGVDRREADVAGGARRRSREVDRRGQQQQRDVHVRRLGEPPRRPAQGQRVQRQVGRSKRARPRAPCRARPVRAPYGAPRARRRERCRHPPRPGGCPAAHVAAGSRSARRAPAGARRAPCRARPARPGQRATVRSRSGAGTSCRETGPQPGQLGRGQVAHPCGVRRHPVAANRRSHTATSSAGSYPRAGPSRGGTRDLPAVRRKGARPPPPPPPH